MEYFPFVIAVGGLVLIASSFVDLSKIKGFFAKKKQPMDSLDLLSEYIKIRALLVKKIEPAKLAEIDSFVLDELTGDAAND